MRERPASASFYLCRLLVELCLPATTAEWFLLQQKWCCDVSSSCNVCSSSYASKRLTRAVIGCVAVQLACSLAPCSVRPPAGSERDSCDRLGPRRIRRRSLRSGGRCFLRMRAGSTARAKANSWPKFAWQNHHLSYTTSHALVSGPTRLPRAVPHTFHAKT